MARRLLFGIFVVILGSASLANAVECLYGLDPARSQIRAALAVSIPASIREEYADLHEGLITEILPRFHAMGEKQRKRFIHGLSQIEFRANLPDRGQTSRLSRKVLLVEHLRFAPELAYVVLRHEISHLERLSERTLTNIVSFLKYDRIWQDESLAFGDHYDYIHRVLTKAKVYPLVLRMSVAVANGFPLLQMYRRLDDSYDLEAIMNSADPEVREEGQAYALSILEGNLLYKAFELGRNDYIKYFWNQGSYQAADTALNALGMVAMGTSSVSLATALILAIFH